MDDHSRFIALLSQQPLAEADVLFLAAGDGNHRVPYAAKLYKEKFAPRIAIVSNDTRYDYGSAPSSELAAELIKYGVPEHALHVEEVANNSKSESVRMMELAKKNGWKTLLLVTSPHHQYRIFLTWLKSMRDAGIELILINAPAPLPWFADNPWGRRADLLEQEWKRIEEYQRKGDVASFVDGISYLEWKEKNI